ncbi:hypothetical protein P7H38_07510 [Lactococcus raffinolactis]|uniref:hypothetical protein n=1 Tax=Pseudolactococcus raffinolactis TaxID=1366 RepID=UPI00288F9D9C|nr:hypothetical protein [Lactococcus raffinolactis]MDT2766530.1 hypothetical protein [Lactococcus raffinolactis]MDT2789690.1 hypothetical protein [Lactococcus raffinolactis]
MKIENTAKDINKYSTESLSVENLDNGEFEIIATQELFNIDQPNDITRVKMQFSKNGFAALVGSMKAAESLGGEIG